MRGKKDQPFSDSFSSSPLCSFFLFFLSSYCSPVALLYNLLEGEKLALALSVCVTFPPLFPRRFVSIPSGCFSGASLPITTATTITMASTSSDLFKKFTLQNVAQIASSSQKEQNQVREDLKDQFPDLEEFWEEILPKKRDIYIIRCQGQVHCITLVSPQPEVLFFNHHDGPYMPHLKLLHKYPFMLKSHQMDIGGCRYVVSGADVMCPGLTSEGGQLSPGVEEGEVVGVYVEGKQHAVAVGVALMSTDDIKKKNKGPAIENVHHLGDGLWMNPVLSASHISV